jgi:ABC-type branched-subunit amino acid transport system substrate-binding protein
VAFGEEAADPGVLGALGDAGMATVMASSWAAPRPVSNRATWLSPSHVDLAVIAAVYARKGKKASQVAVIDNGAPTSAASARAFARRFRELGGRVDFEGEWKGSAWGLTRTIKALRANWPQVVFFTGEAGEAGNMAEALGKERELKATKLLGLPTLFDPGFISRGGLATKMSSVVFPAPDYRGSAQLGKAVGLNFPRGSPNYKAYVSYAYRKPGRWSSMVFDGAKLVLDAIEAASFPDKANPDRLSVREALGGIPSYKGIRGIVKFNEKREPAEAKAMIFYALPKVNSREMRWYDKEFGPPFD